MINTTLRNKVRKEAKLKFYKIVALIPLYSNES